MKLVLSLFLLFPFLNTDLMAGAVAAVLQLCKMKKGQEKYNDSPDILDPLNHGQQLPGALCLCPGPLWSWGFVLRAAHEAVVCGAVGVPRLGVPGKCFLDWNVRTGRALGI